MPDTNTHTEQEILRAVSPAIQDTERVSENNVPDTIEQLYIESSNIGLVEFRKRIETHTAQAVREAANELLNELEELQTNYSFLEEDGSTTVVSTALETYVEEWRKHYQLTQEKSKDAKDQIPLEE